MRKAFVRAFLTDMYTNLNSEDVCENVYSVIYQKSTKSWNF